jgi:hypothetical protein
MKKKGSKKKQVKKPAIVIAICPGNGKKKK